MDYIILLLMENAEEIINSRDKSKLSAGLVWLIYLILLFMTLVILTVAFGTINLLFIKFSLVILGLAVFFIGLSVWAVRYLYHLSRLLFFDK